MKRRNFICTIISLSGTMLFCTGFICESIIMCVIGVCIFATGFVMLKDEEILNTNNKNDDNDSGTDE